MNTNDVRVRGQYMKAATCDRCTQLFEYDPTEDGDRMYELRLKSWMVSGNYEKKLRSKSTRLVLCRKCYADLCSWISPNQGVAKLMNI